MKKIRKYFDWIWVFLILLVIFACDTGNKKKKSHWKIALLSVLLIGIILGQAIWTVYDLKHPYNDCIPATIQRVFPNHSIAEMRAIFHTERRGTVLTNIFSGWAKLSTNELTIVFSAVEDVPSDNTHILQFGVPYIWTGFFDGTNGHCCLAFFSKTNVVLSHSQIIPGTTNYYTVTMSYPDMFEKTLLIFTSKDLTNHPIRME